MADDWLTDEQEREPVTAHVFNLLRRIGREPARRASRGSAKQFGAALRAFLRTQKRE